MHPIRPSTTIVGFAALLALGGGFAPIAAVETEPRPLDDELPEQQRSHYFGEITVIDADAQTITLRPVDRAQHRGKTPARDPGVKDQQQDLVVKIPRGIDLQVDGDRMKLKDLVKGDRATVVYIRSSDRKAEAQRIHVFRDKKPGHLMDDDAPGLDRDRMQPGREGERQQPGVKPEAGKDRMKADADGKTAPRKTPGNRNDNDPGLDRDRLQPGGQTDLEDEGMEADPDDKTSPKKTPRQ